MNEQINLLELDNDKLWQFYGIIVMTIGPLRQRP